MCIKDLDCGHKPSKYTADFKIGRKIRSVYVCAKCYVALRIGEEVLVESNRESFCITEVQRLPYYTVWDADTKTEYQKPIEWINLTTPISGVV